MTKTMAGPAQGDGEGRWERWVLVKAIIIYVLNLSVYSTSYSTGIEMNDTQNSHIFLQ